MESSAILAAVDEEIARLKQVRNILADGGNGLSRSARKPRVLSAEARKRIADAQRRRWAAQKKSEKK